MISGFDLHMHSVHSDGSCTVEELIAQARECGLTGIAITDHDSLGHLNDVRAVAAAEGFPVLAGTEASSWNPKTGRKIHVLAYGLVATPTGTSPLERIVDATLRTRTAASLWQACVIARAGFEFHGHGLSLDDVAHVAAASTGVYKQHVMEALTGLPYRDPAYRFCYTSLFKNGGIAQSDIPYPDARDVVQAIRDQGGHPVLAHPGQMDSWDAVPELVEAGLEGIEVHHPDHDVEDVARARELADRFGLMRTGGSDYHGRYGAPESVGCCGVTEEEAGEAVAALFAAEPAPVSDEPTPER